MTDIEKQQIRRDLTVMRLAQHGEKKDLDSFERSLSDDSLASSSPTADGDHVQTRHVEKGRSLMIENDLRNLGWLPKE